MFRWHPLVLLEEVPADDAGPTLKQHRFNVLCLEEQANLVSECPAGGNQGPYSRTSWDILYFACQLEIIENYPFFYKYTWYYLVLRCYFVKWQSNIGSEGRQDWMAMFAYSTSRVSMQAVAPRLHTFSIGKCDARLNTSHTTYVSYIIFVSVV